MRTAPKHRVRPLLVVAAAAAACTVAGVAYAAFVSTTSNPASSFSAKRIFPAERATAAWKLEDAADGSAAVADDEEAFVDGRLYTTGAWSTAWSTTRYLEFELNSPLPAGLPVSGVNFNFTFADAKVNPGTGDQWCYYFETRKTSDGSLIQAHGSSTSTIGCEDVGAQKTITTALPEITTTNAANDLTIRVFGMHSSGAFAITVDRATVTGSGYAGFTLYSNHHVDRATGTATTRYWGPAKVNAQAFQNTGAWATAYSASRYLRFTFPAYLPGSATVTGATFEYTYKSQTSGDNTCYYFEVYAGSTLIGTHGSTTSDIDCNSTALYETIATALAEVDTVAEANSIAVKLFAKNSGVRASLTDGAILKLTYSLDAGSGCADSATRTLLAVADTYVDEDSPGANFGPDPTFNVQSDTGALKQRAFVLFDLPPTGSGCSITAATLRLFLSATGGARTLNAYQAAASWGESTLTWDTQPATTGTPGTGATGGAGTWTTWNVLSVVQSMYTGSNYGFVVKDASETSGSVAQTFHSREGASDPQLVLTVG